MLALEILTLKTKILSIVPSNNLLTIWIWPRIQKLKKLYNLNSKRIFIESNFRRIQITNQNR